MLIALFVFAMPLYAADYSWHRDNTATLGKDGKSWKTIYVNDKIIFEGATNDASETTLTLTEPTADNTITIPNASGTIVVTNGAATWGALLWGDGGNSTDTGTEICTLAGLSCVLSFSVAGASSACSSDMGASGTYFYSLCK